MLSFIIKNIFSRTLAIERVVVQKFKIAVLQKCVMTALLSWKQPATPNCWRCLLHSCSLFWMDALFPNLIWEFGIPIVRMYCTLLCLLYSRNRNYFKKWIFDTWNKTRTMFKNNKKYKEVLLSSLNASFMYQMPTERIICLKNKRDTVGRFYVRYTHVRSVH